MNEKKNNFTKVNQEHTHEKRENYKNNMNEE